MPPISAPTFKYELSLTTIVSLVGLFGLAVSGGVAYQELRGTTEQLTEKFITVSSRVDSNFQELNGIQRTIAVTGERLPRLDSEIDNIKVDIRAVLTQLNTLNTQITVTNENLRRVRESLERPQAGIGGR